MPSSARRASDRYYEGSSASDSEQSPDPQFELPRRERRSSCAKQSRRGGRQQSRSRSRSRGGTIREERAFGSNVLSSTRGYGQIGSSSPTLRNGRSSQQQQHDSDFEIDDGNFDHTRVHQHGQVHFGGRSMSWKSLVLIVVVSPAQLILCR